MTVGYPLKSQSINTSPTEEVGVKTLDIHLKVKALTLLVNLKTDSVLLDIHLKVKALTLFECIVAVLPLLDIHLKVKALTLFKPEHNESQLYITKIK